MIAKVLASPYCICIALFFIFTSVQQVMFERFCCRFRWTCEDKWCIGGGDAFVRNLYDIAKYSKYRTCALHYPPPISWYLDEEGRRLNATLRAFGILYFAISPCQQQRLFSITRISLASSHLVRRIKVSQHFWPPKVNVVTEIGVAYVGDLY